jgi:hypothetical protein
VVLGSGLKALPEGSRLQGAWLCDLQGMHIAKKATAMHKEFWY